MSVRGKGGRADSKKSRDKEPISARQIGGRVEPAQQGTNQEDEFFREP